MSYLLDTCVVSELAKPEPNEGVLAWVREAVEEMLFLSVITFGELEKGIAKLPESFKKKRLQSWVRKDLADRFAGRILGIDIEIAARWGALVGQSERDGLPLPVIDSLIAATCLHHELIVVTRNTDDFERCGARCLNPWKS